MSAKRKAYTVLGRRRCAMPQPDESNLRLSLASRSRIHIIVPTRSQS